MNIIITGRVSAAILMISAVLGAGATRASTSAADENATPADSAGGLEEIVVTAQKRQESLQDVPFAVTALSATALEQRGINNLNDFIDKPTTGLEIAPMSGNPSLLMAEMRGVSTSDGFTPTKELGVPIYIDDVYLSRAAGLGLELADPERIEILRGPQGQLFGRNAEGGAIRIVSQKPTGEFGVLAEGTKGTWGLEREKFTVNLPAFAGFSAKFSYAHSERDGWVKDPPSANIDPSAITDAGLEHGSGLRAALRWRPIDALTVDYSFDRESQFATTGYLQLTGIQPNSPHGAQPIVCGGECRVDSEWASFFNRGNHVNSYGHTLTAAYEINQSLQVKSISAYRNLDSLGALADNGTLSFVDLTSAFAPGAGLPPGTIGVPFGTFPMRPGFPRILDPSTLVYAVQGVDAFDEVKQHQFSQEIQLLGSTEQLQYVAGLYYFKENIFDDRDTGFTGIYTDPAELNFVGTNPFEFGGENTQTAQTKSYAAFSQATWTPSFIEDKRLHLTAGLRYTSDKKEFNRTLEASVPVDRTPPPFETKRVDPAFVVAWDWTSDINNYLRFAQAYRSGGYDLGSPTLDPYGKEVNKALELGLKSLLDDHKIRLNMAAFYSWIYGFQNAIQIDPTNPNIIITVNAPAVTTVFGVENEAAYEPLPGLTFTADYSYQNGRLPLAAFRTVDPAGIYRIENLPRHKIGAGVDYESHILPLGALVFHLDYAWTSPYSTSGGERVTDTANAILVQRNVANARITLQDLDFRAAHMKVAVFANNLFNKSYGDYAPIFGGQILAPPRVVGVTVTADLH